MANVGTSSNEAAHPRNSRRRRAAQACLHCRKRKVRCDVASKGQPCTNCTMDNTACEVKRRQQRRQLDILITPPATASIPLSPSSSTTCLAPRYNNDNIQPASGSEGVAGFTSSGGMPLPPNRENYVTASDTGPSDHTVQRSCMHLKDLEGLDANSRPEAVPSGSIGGGAPSSTDTEISSSQSAGPWTEWTNYRFLHAKVCHDMPEWDLNLLQQRGCFSIPVRGLLNEFTREYFLHVHPNLPVINEADFWDTYTNNRREPISLVLFQAMLFAACSFVSQSTIRRLGFKSLRAARAALYSRAKALYDLDVHDSDLCCAQTALLLTYYTSSKNPNINTYWLTVALHHARVIHAHRYYELKHHEKANLLKRVWWACVCRDRLLSLGVRRPFQISADDFDFSQSALTISDLSDEIYRSLVYSAPAKRALLQLFNLQCELCVALTTGLILLSPLTVAAVVNQEHLSDGIEQLLRWYEQNRAHLDYPVECGVEHDSTVLYKSLLLIYYHSAQLALQNHAIYLETTRGTNYSTNQDTLKSRVSDHMRGITDCLLELGQRNLLGYLPITTAANITLPLTWYMISTQTAMEGSDTIGPAPQLIYPRAFKILQTQYEGTDQVLDYIHKIINQLRLEATSSNSRDRGIADRHRATRPSPRVAPIVSSPTMSRAEENAVVIYNFAHCPPGEYVRISKTIDLSLATGRFPDRTDLPTALQSFKPTMDTRLYSSVAFRRGSESLAPSRDRTHPLQHPCASASVSASASDAPYMDSLLGEYVGWDVPTIAGGGGDSSPGVPPDDSALMLQSTPLEHFRTLEGFSLFSSASSAGDLDCLFPLPSAVDSADGASDETMMNLFPYD
ncbi:fungal-specific transcription factor domain-containing protein [Aspergillus carlsbadensis]|nr:fungal-specific transcription factor domain-containing protein [Aspergillus carlsbadensis]